MAQAQEIQRAIAVAEILAKHKFRDHKRWTVQISTIQQFVRGEPLRDRDTEADMFDAMDRQIETAEKAKGRDIPPIPRYPRSPKIASEIEGTTETILVLPSALGGSGSLTLFEAEAIAVALEKSAENPEN